MQESLRIKLIQPDLYWENKDANLAHLEELLWENSGEADLIVLPEMFNTGFTMNTISAGESPGLNTTRWMVQQAKQQNAALTGSFIVEDKGHYYNRMLWVTPDGKTEYYDKRHLFRMASEHNYFAAGGKRVVVSLKGWKIALFICYDLRFPVWCRNKNQEYDLAIFVANWPEPRVNAWDTLLKGRAIENLCYVAGVNRTGKDGNNVMYNGHSAVYGPKGEEKVLLGQQETTSTVQLSHEELTKFRNKFPAHNDADDFIIQ